MLGSLGRAPTRTPPRAHVRDEPPPRSSLRTVGKWLALTGVATALMIGLLMIPRASEAVKAVGARTIYGKADADADDATAGTGGAEGAAEGADGGEEYEDVEIPVEVVQEARGDDHELENAPAELPEGAEVPEPSPRPEVVGPKVDRAVGQREWVVHRMAPGETISQVAYRYGTRPKNVRLWNGFSEDTEKLRRGSRIKVKASRIPPERLRVEYTVQPGDTWWSIAAEWAVDSTVLRGLNWSAPRKLVAGETLTLWIDPVVYYWVMTDKPAEDEADPVASLRRGAVGVGVPQDGKLINGVQIPEVPGISLRMLPSGYGTTHAVTQLLLAHTDFRERSGYEPDLVLGSMARRHGGPLEGHVSHQSGRDLDVRLPLTAGTPQWFPVQPWRVDFEALWYLLTSLANTGEVVAVFLDYSLQKELSAAAKKLGASREERRRMLQYPRGPKGPGVIRHAKGHDRHFHVRFTCGPHETECASKENDEVAPEDEGEAVQD